jgi:hypothetical protein
VKVKDCGKKIREELIMTKIHNIRFGVSLAFFILVGTGTLADAAVLAPSPGFVNLTNPTGRPECIVLPSTCVGSGNPSAGFTSFTNPTGRPECIDPLANCVGAGNPSPGFTSFMNPTGQPECTDPLANCIGSGNPSPGFTSLTNPTGRPECIVLPGNCTGIPTINPLIPVTAGSVGSTPLGVVSAFRVDLPAALDIPATLGVMTLANQTIANPEPTTVLLFGSGLSGVFLIRKFAGQRRRVQASRRRLSALGESLNV